MPNAVQIIWKFLPIIFFLLTTILTPQKNNNFNLFKYMDIGKLKSLNLLEIESFSWKTTLNFGCPTALNDQLEVYYKVDRLLNGLLSL